MDAAGTALPTSLVALLLLTTGVATPALEPTSSALGRAALVASRTIPAGAQVHAVAADGQKRRHSPKGVLVDKQPIASLDGAVGATSGRAPAAGPIRAAVAEIGTTRAAVDALEEDTAAAAPQSGRLARVGLALLGSVVPPARPVREVAIAVSVSPHATGETDAETRAYVAGATRVA